MVTHGLDHINIDTALVHETIEFYQEVLGLENRPNDRPAFDFPGAWLFLEDRAIIHLNFVEESRAASTGAFNHIAFTATDLSEVTQALDALGVDYRVSDRPELGLTQVFATDPNQIMVEINVRS